jgi:two-component system, chemotaxis family, chemotaxis protein CheY
MKLLIVDDSNMIRTRIARVVQLGELKGIQLVGLAKNGVEAIRLAKATKPHLVTMDLTMPEMDGVEAIQAIIAMDPNVSILVVSALADKSTAIQALRMGAKGFLNKPFSDEELRAALVDVCDLEQR